MIVKFKLTFEQNLLNERHVSTRFDPLLRALITHVFFTIVFYYVLQKASITRGALLLQPLEESPSCPFLDHDRCLLEVLYNSPAVFLLTGLDASPITHITVTLHCSHASLHNNHMTCSVASHKVNSSSNKQTRFLGTSYHSNRGSSERLLS